MSALQTPDTRKKSVAANKQIKRYATQLLMVKPDIESLVKHFTVKPEFKGDDGLKCVRHLPQKWTDCALTIREGIYDPDHYDDGTYAPMYIRLAKKQLLKEPYRGIVIIR